MSWDNGNKYNYTALLSFIPFLMLFNLSLSNFWSCLQDLYLSWHKEPSSVWRRNKTYLETNLQKHGSHGHTGLSEFFLIFKTAFWTVFEEILDFKNYLWNSWLMGEGSRFRRMVNITFFFKKGIRSISLELPKLPFLEIAKLSYRLFHKHLHHRKAIEI